MVPKEQVRQLYVEGLSTRQIAKFLGYSHSYIHKICKGITRDRREAVLLSLPEPKETKHWRTCRNRARRVMERHLGRKLESFEHVHHEDEDYTNNRISNLKILSPSDHAKLHHPKNPTPRHLRPERQVWMQTYQQNRKSLRTICAWCTQVFMADRYAKPECCSHPCAQSLVWSRRNSKET